LTAILALLAGLAVFTVLIAWQGLDTVAATFGLAGWNPLWLPVYFFCLPIALSTLSWRAFFAPRPPFLPALHAMWIGLAVNWMLPVAQIGGEFVRARIIARRGVAAGEAYASALVDKTSQALTQLTYAVCGIVLFAGLHAVPDVTYAAAAFAVVLAAGIYTFYRIQQAGLFVAAVKLGAKLVGRFDWVRAAEGAGNVDEAVRGIYARRADFWKGCAWRFAARVVAAGEVWLAFQFLGHPISVLDAVIIESIGQAVRGAAFIVPGALGVQEGGYMLLAAALGIGPELGLALSLCKRVRELAIGIPGLVSWKLWETQHLMRRAHTGDQA
jgi:putative membrane protein